MAPDVVFSSLYDGIDVAQPRGCDGAASLDDNSFGDVRERDRD
jgi:hypothetical protein